MKRWLLALALLLLAAVAGWAWWSPQLALWQMRHAAEARDVDALAGHVDFDKVRDSVKRQLAARMRPGAEEHGVLGALVAAGIADTLVDAAVSPEGMRIIFAAAPLAETERPGTIRLKAQEMRYHRERWDRFRLSRSDGAALVFRLEGFDWKLVDIALPPDALR